MQPGTIKLLRSPITHEGLELIIQDGEASCLRSVPSGVQFPIVQGIACLLDESRVVDYNRKYQRFYNLVAPLYDATLALGAWITRNSEERIRKQYLNELELAPASRLLEVSIGTGANIQYLPEYVDCIGIDISMGMLKKAQANLARWEKKMDLILADAEELPFKDRQFDCVLHVGGINAFNDRQKAISEMIRVARPRTKIVIVDETAELIARLSWFPGAKKLLTKYADRFAAPTRLLPRGVSEIMVKHLWNGNLYCLTFRCPT